MSIREKKSVFLAALSGCMWGTIGLFVNKLGSFGIKSTELVVGRFFIASLIIGLFLIIFNKELLKIRLKDIFWFCLTGIGCLLFFNASYGIAIEKSSMAVAAVLLYTSPAIVTIISAFVFQEKITLRKVFAVLLAISGCAFVSGIMSGILTYPVNAYLWGIGAALGYAMYSIVARVLLKRYHSFTILFYSFLLAAITGCMIADMGKVIDAVALNYSAGFWMIGAALVCNVFSYVFYNLALKNLEPSRVSVIASIEPAIAALLGVIILKESIDFWGILGIVCILCAIVILNQTNRRSNEG